MTEQFDIIIPQEHYSLVNDFVFKCNSCEEIVLQLTPQNFETKLLYHRIRKFNIICEKCKSLRDDLRTVR